MTADIFPSGVDLGRQADFRIGALQVRPSAREIEADGRKETLEPRVMQALVVLAARTGEVVSREALIDSCWEGRSVGDDAINRCMAKLRRVGMAFGAFALETIPRVGYRLNLVGPEAHEAVKPGRSWVGRIAGGIAIVAALGAGGYLGWRAWASPLKSETPVAVLPFSAAGSDPAARAFAETADEELAGMLAGNRVPVIKPSDRARRLETEGDVRTENDRLFVRIRLRDPRARATLWSREFSAPQADGARLRTEIGWRLTYVMQVAEEVLHYSSPDFDSVSLGYVMQISDEIVQGNWAMITPAEALIQRSPRSAGPHSGIAVSYLARASFATEAEGAELHRKAMEEIRRAAELDPKFPWQDPLSVATDSRNWAERERLNIEAHSRRLGPPQPNLALAQLMINSGRLRDGTLILSQLHASRRAQPGAGAALAYLQHMNGMTDVAIVDADRYIAMRPTDAMLKRSKLVLVMADGRYAEARTILANPDLRPRGITSDGAAALVAYLDARESGGPAARARAARGLAAQARTGGVLRYFAMSPLVQLGALDEAFATANDYAADHKVMRQNLFLDTTFLFAPEARPLREDPRFIPLVEKLGLLKYWRETGKWPDFCETEPKSICARMKAGA